MRICLVDSGVDYTHPGILNRGRSYAVEVDVAGGSRIAATDELDVVGHGTACASVISRIAPDAELDSLRILGPRNKGRGGALLDALSWAIEQEYHVVNLSLSTRNVQHRVRLLELSELAAAAGVLLVCSAHNSPVQSYPWSLATVISVGSHGRADTHELLVNPRPPVDFYAGGVNVSVAWLNSDSRTMSGNSFATPAVSATLARVIETFPRLQPWQYKYLLSTLAANVRRGTDE